MPLDQIANIAEISAVILVIVTLSYVGIQIRQHTDALRVNTAHSTSEDFSATYSLMAERGELADILFRGMQNLEALKPVERFRFYCFHHKLFRSLENAHYQFKQGALEAEPFEGINQQLLMLKTQVGVQTYWHDRKNMYTKTFQKYVDDEIWPREVKGYKLAGT